MPQIKLRSAREHSICSDTYIETHDSEIFGRLGVNVERPGLLFSVLNYREKWLDSSNGRLQAKIVIGEVFFLTEILATTSKFSPIHVSDCQFREHASPSVLLKNLPLLRCAALRTQAGRG
ncbi:hypothetical protein ABW21_db0201523 [Orbilia brochopaga]|nr:hypothetical protein ABW21_db0201523 [Drechslerella brochopaga]